MSLNKSTTYDLQVNHSVSFACGKHKRPLMGTPKWDFIGDPPVVSEESIWRVDTSDMWCPDEGVPEQPGYEECTDSWVTVVDGLHVAL